MRKAKENAARNCPVCGKVENQVNAGKNRSGSQRCFCKECGKYYTFEPKTREYSEEVREMAKMPTTPEQAGEKPGKYPA